MNKDIKNYVKSCEICKMAKTPTYNTMPTMGNKKEATKVFELLMTDFMGEFPRSNLGNKYLLVITDYVSKYVILKATPNQTAEYLTKYLEREIFYKYSCPKEFLCDNGPVFKSNLFKTLMAKFGIKLNLIPRYTPQANNTERVNKTIGACLRSLIDFNQKDWDENLHIIQWALNTSVHETTKYSPYYIVYLQKNKFSGLEYTIEEANQDKIQNIDDSFKKRKEEYEFVQQIAQSNLKEAYEKSKQRYNLRKRNINFDVGEVVMKRNFVLSNKSLSRCAKLCSKFIKARVIKKYGNNAYELGDYITGKSLGTFHTKDILKF